MMPCLCPSNPDADGLQTCREARVRVGVIICLAAERAIAAGWAPKQPSGSVLWEEVLVAYKNGEQATSIARRFGISAATVHRHVRAADLPPRSSVATLEARRANVVLARAAQEKLRASRLRP